MAKKPYDSPLLRTKETVNEVVEDVTVGIDPRLGTVTGTCPFCGGLYAAGYLVDDSPDGEPRATIRHSAPACWRFQVNARVFLTDANKQCPDRRAIRP
jgi:hypothetical protein